MLERELKFFVPQEARESLSLAYSQIQTGVIRLAAIYFDTPERDLAQAQVALRLRLEGERWVQTVKLAGPDTFSRIEYNHPRPGPTLDFNLYNGTPAAAVLQAHQKNIKPRYETDIERRLAWLQTDTGAELEMAWDQGSIKAGGLTLAVNELEVELLKGDVQAMFDVGEHWQYKHQLILELRSKSERGDALARLQEKKQKKKVTIADTAAELNRKAFQLAKPHTIDNANSRDFYRHATTLSLEQVIRNASLLAGIDGIRPGPERQADYLAAMRVGLRRLRSCRKLFKPWLSRQEQDSDKQLHHYFGLFGHARDYDMVHLEVTPLLLKAGMPEPAPELAQVQSEHDPVELAGAAEFQSLLLRVLQAQLIGQPLDIHAERPLQVHERIQGWFNSIQRGSLRFDHLSAEKQHQLRNRIKTLRYCLEFSAQADEGLNKILRECQNVIGHVTDMDVALAWYARHALSPEQAIFAQQWLSKTRQSRVIKAQQALKALGTHQKRLSAQGLL